MDLESRLRLAADIEAVRAFAATAGGHLLSRAEDPVGLYWLVLSHGDVQFIARIAWRTYPGAPPSVLFATEVGGATSDPRGWPSAVGFRPPNDICKPFTAEGHALHPEWAPTWRRGGNPFLWVVETIHGDIVRGGWRRAA